MSLPTQTAAVDESRVALVKALRRLPAHQRQALVLHHMCDLPVRAVALEVGVPEGTVKARLSRGRAALAALLDPNDPDFFRSCPTEDFDDGFTRVGQVIRTDEGAESWAMVRHFERAGAPALGLDVVHVTRVGRAVLIDTVANEGGGGPEPEREAQQQLDAMSAATAVPVERMCTFTEAGCPEGLTPSTGRHRRP